MPKHRFFIDNIDAESNFIEVNNKDVIHQIINVLRLKIGDRVVAFDNSSNEYKLTLKEIMKTNLIFSKEIMKKESILNKVSLILYPAMIKKDKLEYVFQKCTEIGVTKFQPIISFRTEKLGINLDRIKKIIKEASEQSGRNLVPQVLGPTPLEELVLEYETSHETKCETMNNKDFYYLDIGAKRLDIIALKKSLNDKNTKTRELHIFVGPEGGWDEADRKQLERLAAKPISLGEGVMRAETASIVISALILLPN